MNTKTNLYLTALLLPAVGQPTAIKAETLKKNQLSTDRPNVIIILGDDVGYGDLQCYGAKNVETPHINRLAQSGIRFTDCHAIAATSTPSRYSLLTGEYAWRRDDTDVARSEERRVGKECRSRWSPY